MSKASTAGHPDASTAAAPAPESTPEGERPQQSGGGEHLPLSSSQSLRLLSTPKKATPSPTGSRSCTPAEPGKDSAEIPRKGPLSVLRGSTARILVGNRLVKIANENATLQVLSSNPLGPLFETEPMCRDSLAVEEAVDHWLQSLPASGAELAPELRIVPLHIMQDVFQRGRLVSCHKGQRLQEEGGEVKHYTIVLSGRCRMRCKAPNTRSNPNASMNASLHASSSSTLKLKTWDEDDDLDLGATGSELESFVTCQVVGRGDTFGLIPGEFPSGYDIVAADKATMLLQLSAEDYQQTLQDVHRDMHEEALEFFRRHGLCQNANPQQLRRLITSLRQRTLRRGKVSARYGEPQRHVWLLRSGSAILRVPDQVEAGDAASGDAAEEDAEEAAREERLRRMRGLSGDKRLNAAAFDRDTQRVVSKYARGPLKGALKGDSKQAAGPSGQQNGFVTTARIGEPGAMLGEEVLLHKDFRDMVAQSYCYTVQAAEDCSFYMLDLTTFRQLLMFVGAETVARTVKAKLSRRDEHISRGDKVNKQLVKEARELQSFENRKQERQKLRLPPSTGYSGAQEIDSLDDWLGVVLEHRKKPPDLANPVTLKCLEAVKLKGTVGGPGVEAMLRVYADAGSLKEYRSNQRGGPLGRRAANSKDVNPMGEVIAPTAKYDEVAPPASWFGNESTLALEDEAPLAITGGSLPSRTRGPPADGGISFLTAIDDDDDDGPAPPPPAVSSTLQAPSAAPPAAVPPRAPLGASGLSVTRSSSTPSLPKIRQAGQEVCKTLVRSSSSAAMPRPAAAEELAPREAAARAAKSRTRNIMRAFEKAIPGKSILVFTDDKATKRSVAKAFQGSAEIPLAYVRSTIELWQRLYEAKEHYSALLLDLSKSELEVESLLRTIKQHERYAKLPIIVLSSDRELPEVVRTNCSFVVFLPLSASTLREALLWCFDRQTVQQNCNYDLSYASPQVADTAGESDMMGQVDMGLLSLRVKAQSMSVTRAIPVA